MNPETAEQLQQNENEVSRLRDTLSGLRKQIDSEKGMQERILREFRASILVIVGVGVAVGVM